MKYSLITKIITLILFSASIQLTAQEKEADVMPEIIGGMKALGKNVVYPEQAKKAQITGKVFVKAVIDVEGNVKEASIIEGVHELLNKAAIDAVKKTKFKPGMKDGKPVDVEVTIPISFKLNGEKKKK